MRVTAIIAMVVVLWQLLGFALPASKLVHGFGREALAWRCGGGAAGAGTTEAWEATEPDRTTLQRCHRQADGNVDHIFTVSEIEVFNDCMSAI